MMAGKRLPARSLRLASPSSSGHWTGRGLLELRDTPAEREISSASADQAIQRSMELRLAEQQTEPPTPSARTRSGTLSLPRYIRGQFRDLRISRVPSGEDGCSLGFAWPKPTPPAQTVLERLGPSTQFPLVHVPQECGYGYPMGTSSVVLHRHGHHVHRHAHRGSHRHLVQPRRSQPLLLDHKVHQLGEHGHSHGLVERSIVRSREVSRSSRSACSFWGSLPAHRLRSSSSQAPSRFWLT